MYRYKRKVINKNGKVFAPGTTVGDDIPTYAISEMMRVGDIEKVKDIPDADIPFAEYEPEHSGEKVRRTRKKKEA